MTPVARIAPQSVGGVTVENTTLHNPGEVSRLGIKIGDKILIVRRGDVIPKIEQGLGEQNQPTSKIVNMLMSSFSVELSESSEIIAPRVCPSCDSELVTEGLS